MYYQHSFNHSHKTCTYSVLLVVGCTGGIVGHGLVRCWDLGKVSYGLLAHAETEITESVSQTVISSNAKHNTKRPSLCATLCCLFARVRSLFETGMRLSGSNGVSLTQFQHPSVLCICVCE
jgi:hypothetical protein